MAMNYTKEIQTAVEAVVHACHLCRQVQAALVNDDALDKKDKSPVTVADFGAQAVVSHLLQQAFPNDPLVGEEHSGALREADNAAIRAKVVEHVATIIPALGENDILAAIDRGDYAGGAAGRFWTLDPIDGTKGFLRGDQYAVALALIEEGKPVLGILGCPNLLIDAQQPGSARGTLFIAARGQGTQMRPIDAPESVAVSVASITDPAQANFCESVESGHSSHDDAAQVAQLLGVTAEPFRIDSQCKYAAVARGDASIYLRLPTRADYREKIWDHAAGWMVVTEAGGRVTDVAGRDLDFSLGRKLEQNTGVVATNGHIHDAVIDAVRQTLGL